MILIEDITSSNWSISLAGPGEIVTDIVDIKQCHFVIVLTAKGSAPFLPDFGCDVYDSIGQPLAVAAPKMCHAIKVALEKYEPRSTILNVTYTFGVEGAIRIRVEWTLSSQAIGLTDFTTEFEINEGVIYLVDEFNRYILTEFGIITI